MNALKNLANKIVENRATIIRYTLIGIGSVAGLVVGAGLVSKATTEVEEALDTDASEA